MKIKFKKWYGNKIKVLITVSVFIFSLNVATQAQDVGDNPGGGSFYDNHLDSGDPVSIPNSPEAATLGRFGNLPINKSTGQMNFSVPIHNITVDGHSTPISLQYNYGGLILEGKAALAGLGWNLAGTGTVVREVRGLPDEHPNGYYGTNPHVQNAINDYKENNDIDFLTLRDKFYKGVYDSEVDRYTVTMGGMTFSFKIDANGEAYFISLHNNTVEVVWNTHAIPNQIDAFIVTSDQGVKYRFDSIERSIPYKDEDILLNPITSWNISKITYPNGQEIVYSYIDDVFANHNFSARGAALSSNVGEDLTNTPIFFSPVYRESFSTTSILRKILTRIDFPLGSIEFSLKQDHTRDLYEKIVVQGMDENQVVCEYVLSHSGVRDMLNKITKNGVDYYDFEYFNHIEENPNLSNIPDFIEILPGSPAQKPYAQDRWKYFNGAYGNTAALSIPASNYTANLNPSFEHTRRGALKKITYPTKGTTEVIYEQNQIASTNVLNAAGLSSLPIHGTFIHEMQLDGPNGQDNYKESTQRITFNNATVATIEHSAFTNDLDNTHIVISINKIDNCDYQSHYPIQALPFRTSTFNYNVLAPYLRDEIERLDIEDLNADIPPICPAFIFEWSPAGIGNGTPIEEGHSLGKVLILPGTYEISIRTDFNKISTANAKVMIKYNEEQANGTPSEYVNVDVGGLRVKELKDCNDQGECYSRFFDYNTIEGFSTGKLMVDPLRVLTSNYRATLPDNSIIQAEFYDYSTEYTPANTDFGSPVFYRQVSESQFQERFNGYTLTEYEYPVQETLYRYPDYPRGIDLYKGRAARNEVHKFLSRTDNVPTGIIGETTSVTETEILQATKNKYQPLRKLVDGNQLDFDPNHPLSFKVVRVLDRNLNFVVHSYGEFPSENDIAAVRSLYQIVPYKELDFSFQMIENESTGLEENGTITQKTINTYDKLQIASTEVTDSRGDVLRTEYFYPFNDTATPVHQDMVEANQIMNPIEIKRYWQDELIAKQLFDFSNLSNISNAADFRLRTTNTVKADTEVDSRIQYQYDSFGNVAEVRIPVVREETSPVPLPSRDRVTSYIWGYEGMYPIAKLENVPRTALGLSSDFAGLSSADKDRTIGYQGTEGALREALDNLRTVFDGDALITTYTYDPFIGMTSMTDPSGRTTYYEYDVLNRLESVKDEKEYLRVDHEYHYKNQE